MTAKVRRTGKPSSVHLPRADSSAPLRAKRAYGSGDEANRPPGGDPSDDRCRYSSPPRSPTPAHSSVTALLLPINPHCLHRRWVPGHPVSADQGDHPWVWCATWWTARGDQGLGPDQRTLPAPGRRGAEVGGLGSRHPGEGNPEATCLCRMLLCQTRRHAEEPWPPHFERRQTVSASFAGPCAVVGPCAAPGPNAAP